QQATANLQRSSRRDLDRLRHCTEAELTTSCSIKIRGTEVPLLKKQRWSHVLLCSRNQSSGVHFTGIGGITALVYKLVVNLAEEHLIPALVAPRHFTCRIRVSLVLG